MRSTHIFTGAHQCREYCKPPSVCRQLPQQHPRRLVPVTSNTCGLWCVVYCAHCGAVVSCLSAVRGSGVPQSSISRKRSARITFWQTKILSRSSRMYKHYCLTQHTACREPNSHTALQPRAAHARTQSSAASSGMRTSCHRISQGSFAHWPGFYRSWPRASD